jgi:8-oxo-dGTP pyrophosphatase MutT (NUDIX family)
MDKTVIYRAGVIPYYTDPADEKIKMLFMKPASTKFGADYDADTDTYIMRYQLAKGRVERHETAEEAALREGEEEVGLRRENIISYQHIGTFLGRTDVYIARIIDPTDFVPFHYETESIAWMTLDEFEVDGRELHRDLVRDCHIIMEQNEDYFKWN